MQCHSTPESSKKNFYSIPQFPDFFSMNFTLTQTSKEFYKLGREQQGYVIITDLKSKLIHLVPAFNKNDGLPRTDINGDKFAMCVESIEQLGGNSGMVHKHAIACLQLIGNPLLCGGLFKLDDQNVSSFRGRSSQNMNLIEYNEKYLRFVEKITMVDCRLPIKRSIPTAIFSKITHTIADQLNLKKFQPSPYSFFTTTDDACYHHPYKIYEKLWEVLKPNSAIPTLVETTEINELLRAVPEKQVGQLLGRIDFDFIFRTHTPIEIRDQFIMISSEVDEEKIYLFHQFLLDKNFLSVFIKNYAQLNEYLKLLAKYAPIKTISPKLHTMIISNRAFLLWILDNPIRWENLFSEMSHSDKLLALITLGADFLNKNINTLDDLNHCLPHYPAGCFIDEKVNALFISILTFDKVHTLLQNKNIIHVQDIDYLITYTDREVTIKLLAAYLPVFEPTLLIINELFKQSQNNSLFSIFMQFVNTAFLIQLINSETSMKEINTFTKLIDSLAGEFTEITDLLRKRQLALNKINPQMGLAELNLTIYECLTKTGKLSEMDDIFSEENCNPILNASINSLDDFYFFILAILQHAPEHKYLAFTAIQLWLTKGFERYQNMNQPHQVTFFSTQQTESIHKKLITNLFTNNSLITGIDLREIPEELAYKIGVIEEQLSSLSCSHSSYSF